MRDLLVVGGHLTKLAFVGRVEDVIHLFDLQYFPHVLKLGQQLQEHFFVEQNPCAPAFSVVVGTMLSAS